MRNRIARLLLSLANKIATESMCSVEGKWQFRRGWEAVPYEVRRPTAKKPVIRGKGWIKYPSDMGY